MVAPVRSALVLARDDPADAAARAVLRFHLRAFAREAVGARAGEVEAIHQLRVATRRLRAGLRLFAPILPVAPVAAAREDLAWLGRAIGAVRDLDVLALALGARARRLDGEMRDALGPLERIIRERRAAAHATLVDALDSPRGRAVADRLRALAQGGPSHRETPLGKLAPGLLQPLVAAVERAGRRVGRDTAPEDLHRLRVRVKRLRYALETLRGLGGRRVAKVVKRLARVQEVLGELQDAVTQRAWLMRWADTEVVPAPTLLAAGALVHRLGRRATRQRRRFLRRWKRVDLDRLARLVRGGTSRRRQRGPRLRLVAGGR